MSPERSSSPLSPQAVAPRMIAMEMDSGNVQEAESPSLQVAENGVQVAGESTVPVTNDDDLTSLSWLQDRNLLKGMNLSKNETDESYNNNKNIKNENGNANGNGNGVMVTVTQSQTQTQALSLKDQQQDYVIPDLSPTSDYVDESSTSAADSSSSSLNSPVPYATNANANTNTNTNINNFTPRNKHPHNVPYDPKIHTTSKPPYSFSCLIFMAIENSEQKALPVKEIYAWILEHFPYFKNAPTGWKNSVRHNLSLNKCFQKVEKAPNLGKGSLWMVDQQYRPNLLQALNRSPFHPCTPLDPSTYLTPKTSHESHKQSHHRLPDPELFPFLSRRLAASEAKHETTSDDSLDDMDAANVMLALKHGPRILKDRRRRSVKMNSPLDLVQVITTSPSEDHTYSAAKSHDNASPDEAFESDDESVNSKKYHYLSIDLEEQRKIEEGADALLNLAGISTLRKRTYSNGNGNGNSNSNGNNGNSNSNSMENSVNIKRKRAHHHNHNHHHKQLQLELVTAEDDEYEKPSQFRPRLLRVKRKNDNQKRKVLNINNNNNNNNNLMKNDWVRHRKAIEESTTTTR